MPELSFATRVTVLLALFLFIAIAELALRGSKARRWLEYSFVLLCGVAATLYGIVNDFVTVNISPSYFVIGKGLHDTANLTRDAMVLGAKAGFSAGVVLGALHVFAATFRGAMPHLPFGLMRRTLPLVLELAVVCSVAGAVAMRYLAYSEYLPRIDTLTGDALTGFYIVWGIHLGAYSGALIATIVNIRRIRASAATSHEPLSTTP